MTEHMDYGDIAEAIATHHDRIQKLADLLYAQEPLNMEWTARRLLINACDTLRQARTQLIHEINTQEV